jgi:integrase/recombinase XerD
MINSAASKLGKLENVQILEYINKYFDELNRKNRDFQDIGKKNRTQMTYETDLRMYFHMMRDKEKGSELEYLNMRDISITQEDFESYIDTLCSLKDKDGNNLYVNKTINKKIASLKGLVRYLKKKKVIEIDISYLELIKGEQVRKNSYGVLEPHEVLEMAELCLQERNKKEQKRALILFAFKTGLRLSELLSLTWNSLIEKGDDYYVKGVGKGNKPFEIKIPTETYEELQLLNKGQLKIFDISDRRVVDLMDNLRTKMNIQPERNIVFHSIRKCFGTLVWKSSDIEEARRALRHENLNTTQIYLGASDYEINDVIFSADKIDDNLYKNVSNEDLLAAIDNLPKNMKLILNLKIQELLNTKRND